MTQDGNNLPDLSILVELAEFYQVNIQEIINGERKSEKVMSEELKQTLEVVANYNDVEKDTMLNKLRTNAIGIAVTLLAVLIAKYVGNRGCFPTFMQWGQWLGICVAVILAVKSIFYISLLKDQMGKNRKQKIKEFNAAITIVIIVVIFNVGIIKLFDAQYNLKTMISNYIYVTYDEKQEKEKIGELDGYTVFIEGLNIDECGLEDIHANEISLTEAIQSKKVSVDDLTRKAWETEEYDNYTIFVFENYEIVLQGKECIIRGMENTP